MANNIVRFCTAALAGSLIGISYERWSSTRDNKWIEDILDSSGLNQKSTWPHFGFGSVSASSSSPPTTRPPDYLSGKEVLEIDPVLSADNLKKSSRFGLPSKDNIRLFNDFIISYDRRLRAPIWVLEHLTPAKLSYNEEVTRKKSTFREDSTLHEYFRAKLADFANSGFDRGHMAPAGNHKTNQLIMDQTFLLSNISPQQPTFNRGGWERLETYIRWRAKRSKNLYCITGPLYLPMAARDGRTYVTYQVIGQNQVSVPTHYYKVVLIENHDGKLEMEAFLLPHDNSLDDSIRLDDYRIPIDRLDIIERASGNIFFDQLQRDKVFTPNSIPGDFKQGPREAISSEKHPKRITA